MRRGSIVWVNLEEVSPPEFGKTRPGLVISNTEQNEILETVVILPISNKPPEIWPLRLKLQLPRKKDSFIIIPGIRQVKKTRLLELMGMVSQETLNSVEEAVQLYFGD